MAVETISTNVYTCDYCGNQTTSAPTGWFQVWVINVMEPKHFDTARCALQMLTEENVAPDINIVVEDVIPVPEPATPVTPEPVEPATPDIVEPATPDIPLEPATPEDPDPVVEEAEVEPPLDPDEPQPVP